MGQCLQRENEASDEEATQQERGAQSQQEEVGGADPGPQVELEGAVAAGQLVLPPQLALRPPQYLAPLLVLVLLEQSLLLPRCYSQHPVPLRPLIGSAHQVHGLASQPIHACSY